jgi:hypothetical protein
MSTKLTFIAASAPAPTVGADTLKSAPLSPAEIDQNFANLRAGVDKLVGFATNQSEENALFADGYVFVVRTDLIAGYTTTTGAGTTTTGAGTTTTTGSGTTTTTTTAGGNAAPTSTIVFSNLV